MKITQIKARQVFDSRGNPTVEADVVIDNQYLGRASVPSGTSTGTHEMLELRDNDPKAYHGQGVLQAVLNVNTNIAQALTGTDANSQKEVDELMISLDGTENKSKLGANAILAVSLAYAWAISRTRGKPLYEYIGSLYGNTNYIMPRPMFNVMNGGKHANWATDIQEYMIIPMNAHSWTESMKIGSEIFHTLEQLLKTQGLSTNVGNEGGFAPALNSNQHGLDLMVQAIEQSGYKLGEDIKFGFDAAASEFYNPSTGIYELKRDKVSFNKEQMIDWIVALSQKYPVASFEDMLAEDDWESWTELTRRLGNEIQIVGDDLLVTNVDRVKKAIDTKACNSLLVKVNQIGTLTETIAAMKLADSAGWKNVVSHRSGETEDVTIAHLVVGSGCGQIKAGSLSRSERICKYNELIRIEESLKGM
jgi:enolase